MNIKALILSGDGINCEIETAHAFKLAGASPEIVHVSDFLEMENLADYHILAFPGGFSFGDEIRSGKILSEKIKAHQFNLLKDFIDAGKPVIGICNGFQILTQLGAFDEFQGREVTLSENDHGTFINKWSTLNIIDKTSLWLKNLPNTIELPIRHKEGNLRFSEKISLKVAMTYQQDPNGSKMQVAGITNSQGNVFGLMPHPEAAVNNLLLPNHKNKRDQENISLLIFKNAVEYCKGIYHAH